MLKHESDETFRLPAVKQMKNHSAVPFSRKMTRSHEYTFVECPENLYRSSVKRQKQNYPKQFTDDFIVFLIATPAKSRLCTRNRVKGRQLTSCFSLSIGLLLDSLLTSIVTMKDSKC